MKVNSEKFQCVIFGNVDDPGEFFIDKHSIVPGQTVHFLGLHLDNKLTFHDHISHICQKASKQVNVLALDSVMSSVKVTRSYSITPLLNVILIIVVHYGIFVLMLIHLKLKKKTKKRALCYVARQMTSPYYEDLL